MRSPRAKSDIPALALVFLLAMAAPFLWAGAGGTIEGFRLRLRNTEARTSWATVSGKLLSIDLTRSGSSTRRSGLPLFVHPRYAYQVGERTYEGRHYDIGPHIAFRGDLAEEIRRRLEASRTLDVLYDPRDPARSVLSTEISRLRLSHYGAISFLAAGLLLAGLPCWVWSLRLWRRSTRSRGPLPFCFYEGLGRALPLAALWICVQAALAAHLLEADSLVDAMAPALLSALSILLLAPLFTIARRRWTFRGTIVTGKIRPEDGRWDLRIVLPPRLRPGAELHLVLREDQVNPTTPLGTTRDVQVAKLEGGWSGDTFSADLKTPRFAAEDGNGDFHRSDWMVRLTLQNGSRAHFLARGAADASSSRSG